MKIVTVACGLVLFWTVATSPGADKPSAGPPIAGDHAERPESLHARQRQLVREAGQLRRETRRRLQNEARAEGLRRLYAIDDLIDIYIALRLDQSLTETERQRLAGKVRSRLLRVEKRLRRESPQAEGNAGPRRAESGTGPATLAAHAAGRTADAAAQLSQHVLAQQGLAGPAAAAAGGAAGAQPLPPDYGLDLADLIQTVIAPSTWVRNGGQGSIYYYRPLRVLVIRQTGEVHERIGGVIGDLRQAGN